MHLTAHARHLVVALILALLFLVVAGALAQVAH